MKIASDLIRKERVIAYIDGFNLYFSIKEAGFSNCKWLDLKKLVDCQFADKVTKKDGFVLSKPKEWIE